MYRFNASMDLVHQWFFVVFLGYASVTLAQDIVEVPLEKWADKIVGWSGEIRPIPELETVDMAVLIVQDNTGISRDFYLQHDQCFGCPLMNKGGLEANHSYVTTVQTKYGNYLDLRLPNQPDDENPVCSGSIHLYDKGVYWLIVTDHGGFVACDLVLMNKPNNIYLALLWAFLIYFGLAVIFFIFKKLYDRRVCQKCCYKSQDLGDFSTSTTALELNGSYMTNGSANGSVATVDKIDLNDLTPTKDSPPLPAPRQKERLKSLDTFRGLSLVIMIYVNYGYCCNYYFFQHAHWNGLMIADLVFPWFIWIMGTSMAFSFRSVVKKKVHPLKVIWKIIFRAIKLFALGIFLASGSSNDMKNIRIPGVLQRFSLTYLFCALIHYPFARLVHSEDKPYKRCKCCGGALRDVLWYWPEWIIQLGILGAHIGITFGLQVPGCPTGYLGPGGWHDGGANFNCTGGAAGYIDRLLIGNNMYKWADPRWLYGTDQYFDPEGTLGTLTSIFHCFIGLQAGKIIMAFRGHKSRIIRWVVWGIITGAIGTLLCKASQNDGWIPLNKNLWSVSYVFVMSGTAFILLVILYLVIDVWKLWSGAPFIYPGMNSIVIYVCHSAFNGYFPISWQMPDITIHWQWQLVTLWGTTFWVIVAFLMYRKKFFVAL